MTIDSELDEQSATSHPRQASLPRARGIGKVFLQLLQFVTGGVVQLIDSCGYAYSQRAIETGAAPSSDWGGCAGDWQPRPCSF